MTQNIASQSPECLINDSEHFEFSRIVRTRVQAVFDEPELSSDGGALVIREATEINGIIEAMSGAIRGDRD